MKPNRVCAMSKPGWVAIIDDDPSVRRSLHRMLQAHGVAVRTYASAEAYLEEAVDDPPHSMVVDVQLAGGMSGLELVGRLEIHAGAPAVILMTGLDIPETLMRAYAARARWLRKPFEAARLLALLPAHLQRLAEPPAAPTTYPQRAHGGAAGFDLC